MAKLLFLGRLEDLAGVPELEVPLQEPTPLADLLLMVPQSLGGVLAEDKIKLALNGELCAREGLVIGNGDELAFLPPVSGG